MVGTQKSKNCVAKYGRIGDGGVPLFFSYFFAHYERVRVSPSSSVVLTLCSRAMASCAKQLESHPDGQNRSTSRNYERSGNPIFILIVLRLKIYGRRELLRNRVSAKRVPQEVVEPRAVR